VHAKTIIMIIYLIVLFAFIHVKHVPVQQFVKHVKQHLLEILIVHVKVVIMIIILNV